MMENASTFRKSFDTTARKLTVHTYKKISIYVLCYRAFIAAVCTWRIHWAITSAHGAMGAINCSINLTLSEGP